MLYIVKELDEVDEDNDDDRKLLSAQLFNGNEDIDASPNEQSSDERGDENDKTTMTARF